MVCRTGTSYHADGLVRGVTGLRVPDAAIMPRLVTGNLNAPVVMPPREAQRPDP